MPRWTQDPNSNDNDTRGDSVEYTDSGMCIPTGKGFIYPPLIYTDPEHASNIPDGDIDSVTERPQVSSYVGDYCEDCVTKWSRCICRPESDWYDDQKYTVRTQTDSPSNVETDRHPIPSNWSDQKAFWNGKVEKLPFSQCEDWDKSKTQETKKWLWLEWQSLPTELWGKISTSGTF